MTNELGCLYKCYQLVVYKDVTSSVCENKGLLNWTLPCKFIYWSFKLNVDIRIYQWPSFSFSPGDSKSKRRHGRKLQDITNVDAEEVWINKYSLKTVNFKACRWYGVLIVVLCHLSISVRQRGRFKYCIGWVFWQASKRVCDQSILWENRTVGD